MTVEIIGRAAKAPGANSPEELFDLLRQRKCMVTQVPADRWDLSRYWHPTIGTRGKTYSFAAGIVEDCFAFDPAVFGISHREAQLMDPQQRMILQLTWQAFESANIDFADLREQRVGVYVGSSALDHGNLVVEDPAAAGPHFMTGNTLSIVSNRISHAFGLNGPSLTIDTACSSSLVALDLAVKALEAGHIDTAIVGGVNALTHPLAFVGFAQARMLSPDGQCRAYDNDGRGYVRAEGGAVVILRRTDVAAANGDRSFARIVASAVNSAGRTNGISLPSQTAQATLLRSLYNSDGVDPNRVAFIEGHGTGTKVGDPAEVWSIGTTIGAARRVPIPIGSIKTNIGHTEPASGLLGLMKAVSSLENNFFPASLHFETPNENVDFDGLNVHVASEPIELLHGKQTRLAGVNSFGFGGTNAHVIISDPQSPRPLDRNDASGKVFFASAHTASALEALLRSHRDAMAKAPSGDLKKIVAAAGANRHHLRHRFVAAGDDISAIVGAVDRRLQGRDATDFAQAEAVQENAKIAFVFSGNGSQWAGMGLDAYRTNTAFRDRFNVIHALFQVRSKIDLIDLLSDPDLDAKLHDTKFAQPLLFAIQASLADVLGTLGVKPDAVFGHSVGEVAAAYVSGAISLVDAVSIVAKRSYHQDRLAGLGLMAVVQLSPDESMAFFQRHGLDDIHVAAINTKRSVSVSGPSDQIHALKASMKADRVAGQILDINYPFHHPSIEIAKNDFLEDMAQIALRPTQIPFISTVTGDVLAGDSLGAGYWWNNVRQPVLFQQATETAIALGCSLFVEIGPRPILLSYLRDTTKDQAATAVAMPSLVRDGKARDPIWHIYARVLANGGVFDRRKAFGVRNSRIELPALQFEPTDMRHEFTSDAVDLYGRRDAPVTLAGWRVDPLSGSWKNHIDANLFADLAEHVVDRKPILPGSAFLEMAISAARQFLDTEMVGISNMEILRPLELAENQLREVSTTVSRDTGDVEIRSRERLSADDWTLHAVARCEKLTASRPEPVISQKGGAARPMIAAAAAYETARQFGLDYGPAFQLLKTAQRLGEFEIEATLLEPRPARNPFIVYNLHPISVDAAFHGLVAVFGNLSGAERGAPYIPVRFGSVRLYAPGALIQRALVSIRRVSAYSLKVDFKFIDKAGTVIADLRDCRFRRTFLRHQKTLEDVSFHQTLVSSRHRVERNVLPEAAAKTPPSLFAAPAQAHPDNAQQMLQAAIYRACFDIARKTARNTGLIAIDLLPGDANFRHFLSNCLYVLEEVDLATPQDGRWILGANSNLPKVSAILNTLFRERPDQIAEIVAVNNVYSEAIRRLDKEHGSPGGETIDDSHASAAQVSSDPTLESIRVHSRATAARVSLLRDAVKAALANSVVRSIVELGSISRSVTADLVRLAAQSDARFIVAEPNESMFAELSLAFEASPHVKIVQPHELASIGPADLVVSAGGHAYELLLSYAQSVDGALFGPSTRLLVCAPAPGPFADFIFGLDEGWFERTTNAEFPVGAVASAEDWSALTRQLRLGDANVAVHDFGAGSVLAVEASSRIESGRSQDWKPASATIVIREGDDFETGSIAMAGSTSIQASEAGGLEQRVSAALSLAGADVNVVFLTGAQGGAESADRLGDLIMRLRDAARVLSLPEIQTDRTASAIRLGIVLNLDPTARSDSGETRSVNAGIRAFARVMRNEFEALEIHTIDFVNDRSGNPEEKVGLAQSVMNAGSANREWSFDDATGRLMEVRVAPGPVTEAAGLTTKFAAATVRQGVASQVGSIAWQTVAKTEPGPGEVRIAVKATGLNFRDVMWAMGMLPEEALEDGFAGTTIGMECAGTIDAIGAGVTDFAIGDNVMAVAPAAFSTHVRVRQSGVARLPARIEPTAGATLPVAFLTAYYALVELARIRPGETVLVHGGAGGVGLAALQIAKARGAKVFATAGSVEKRRLLALFGADRIYSSRTLDFADQILVDTDGAGVDIVLNSLFSEAMEKSIALVKPFGRFLELGKRDFFADTKIGLRPFRRNVSYFGIDADQLLSSHPELSSKLLGEISEMFERGDLVPLPHRVFRHDEITDAFRLMQGSGHIGKIVVATPVPDRDVVQVAPRGPVARHPDGVHLVLGGIGGFGLAAANWLVEGGARKIALCTRGGVADAETAAMIVKWKASGVKTTLHACDVTEEASVSKLLQALRTMGPLKTVVHAAMVLDDALIQNLTAERVRAVVDPKVKAAAIFDRLTRGDRLDDFILFSSVTTLFGNPGQANYVAANGYLEGLARARRAAGLPALAIGFGAISDVGFLSRNTEINDLLAKRVGKTSMTATQALGHVDAYLARDPGTVEAAVVTISELDMSLLGSLKTVESSLFEIVTRSAKAQPMSGDGEQIDLQALIAGKAPQEAEQAIFQLVANEIATILRIPIGEITPTKIIKDVGLDSLMAMELGMGFRQKTGYEMPLSSITQSTTVGDVAQKLFLKVAQHADTASADEEKPVADTVIVDYLAARHANAERAAG